VTYRDDHDAALARAEALERQLAELREKAEDQAADAAEERERLQREIAHYRAKAERAAEVPPLPPEAQATERARAAGTPDGPGPLLFILAVGAVIVLALIVGLARTRSAATAPPNPECTLDTAPSGATIVVIRENRMAHDMNETLRETGGDEATLMPTTYEMTLGKTPLTRTRSEGIMESVVGGSARFEARLEGYAPLEVTAPLAGMGCDATVHALRPRS
jgi:hypothetical protein